MRQSRKLLISIAASLLLTISIFVNTVNACTGIRLIATDGGVVYGRTMEWGAFNFYSRVAIFPQGFSSSGLTPDGLTGKKWNAKYGVVGLDMAGQNYLDDGMNEVGLAAGLFYHNGFASYPSFEKKKSDITISPNDVVYFILSQFATIDEVRAGMKEVVVVGVIEKLLGITVNAHWMVTDVDGKSIIIEFTDGEMKIHESPLGVITNNPNYDWHMTNVRNYLKLSLVAAPDKTMDGINFTPLSGGSGMVGLPGDFTSTSRFIRAVTWTQTARITPTSTETIYEVFRILDNFNVPLGAAEGSDQSANVKDMRSSTQWTTAWDLSKRRLFYHTQNNRRVRSLDLTEIDFSKIGDEIIHIPMDKKPEQDIEYLTVKR